MNQKVGISDIGIFIPKNRFSLAELLEKRSETHPQLTRRLKAAVSSTGQQYIRFPSTWEDSVTLAAESVRSLIESSNDRDWSNQRYYAVGTETTVDQSKPIAAYVNGLLQDAGYEISNNQTTFQIQHACAGGTLGLLSVAGLLKASGRDGDFGVVSCSDVARYQTITTAEITQGSGAASLLVEENPKLLEIDLETQGLSSRDVDDFFRPIGSDVAIVKGRYSMECYDISLEEALEDHAKRKGQDLKEVLRSTDMFVLHVPFYKMPYNALRKSLSRHLDIHGDELEAFLEEKSFQKSIEPIKFIGNTYTASTYITLAFQLAACYEKFGDGIVGKKVIMASYGSGNTMIVLEGTVAPQAVEVIRSWNLDSLLANTKDADFESYTSWINKPKDPLGFNLEAAKDAPDEGALYLKEIREDGYRVYEKK